MFTNSEAFSGFADTTAERSDFGVRWPLIAWFTDPAGNVLPVLQA